VNQLLYSLLIIIAVLIVLALLGIQFDVVAR
jgi:hypothetical protein